MFTVTLFFVVLATLTDDVIGYHGKFCDGNKILDTMQHVMKCNGQGKHRSGHTFFAFDTTLGRQLSNARAGQKIVFDRVSLNVGNAYRNGVFTCPSPGIYYFSWTILSNLYTKTDTWITLNGSRKRVNYSRDLTRKQYYSGTVSILLRLKKGDRVWIQVHHAGGNVHAGHSFFSGMLMKSD